MSIEEFAKAMTFLGLNYNKGFTPEYIKMLYPRFASYSYEQIINVSITRSTLTT